MFQVFCFISLDQAASEQKVLNVEVLGFNICSFLIICTISIPANVLCADSNSLNPVVIAILLFILR